MAFEVKGPDKKVIDKMLAKYLDAIEVEVTQIAIEAERQAKQNITDLKKVDRGFLRNSIDHKVERTRRGIEGTTFAGALHSVWVEFGRLGKIKSPTGTGPDSAKAGFPPIAPIRAWVKRHNSSFAASGRTKSGKARKAKKADLDALAFVIARKIANEGIEPTPFLFPAFQALRPTYKKRIAAAVKRVSQKGIRP